MNRVVPEEKNPYGWTDLICARCKTVAKPMHCCWCDGCHPVVVREMHERLSLPALKKGYPGQGCVNYMLCPEETPRLPLYKGRRRGRVRHVVGHVEDAPVLGEEVSSQ